MTFAEKYCAQNRISPEKFADTVLRQTLRPAGRVLRWLLVLIPDYFAADLELINSVGRLKRMEGFDAEVMDFMYDPNNRGFLRRSLNLRISSRRLHALVRTTLLNQVPSAEPTGEIRRMSGDQTAER